MKNFAFVFPGYGAVHAGLGKSLYDFSEPCARLYDGAAAAFGFDVAALSAKGKPAELSAADVCFPVGFTHSLALFEAAKELLPAPAALAGYSAGEITAFTAAGLFTPADGAAAAKMYSDMRADALKAGELECWRLTEIKHEFVELVTNKMMDAFVQITAVEAPEQTVIIGEREGIQKTLDELEGRHGAKAAKLPNASALHSMMVFPYSAKMQDKMRCLPHGEFSIPVYSNFYGGRMENMKSPADYFASQQLAAVQLSKEIKAMRDDGIELFVVAGADKALAAAIKHASDGAAVAVAEEIKDLQKLAK